MVAAGAQDQPRRAPVIAVDDGLRPAVISQSKIPSEKISRVQLLSARISFWNAPIAERGPNLADALEQTGCISEDVLLHCRTSETHVRGCWVIDLLIGDQLGVPDSRK